jgi:hypothetical protein
MISIIICSRFPSMLAQLQNNIAATIGMPHEIIAINNVDGQYGICQAYNIGARQSRYGTLCFMHEDIKFHTDGWGQSVTNALSDKTIGVLGVAGGTYQPKVPSAYWSSGPEYIRMQVLHTVAQGELILDLINPDSQPIAEVAVADGVWLCSRREVWLKYQFDEQTFPGFHFYDIDYCTAIASQYRICITFGVLLEHFSKGSMNEQWLLAALDYQQKWAAQLPFGPATLSQPTVAAIEKRALTEYVNRLLKSTVSTVLIWQQLWRLAKYGLSRETIGLVRRLIMRRYL